MPRGSPADTLSLIDPVNPTQNIGQGVFAMNRVQLEFQRALHSLHGSNTHTGRPLHNLGLHIPVVVRQPPPVVSAPPHAAAAAPPPAAPAPP